MEHELFLLERGDNHDFVVETCALNFRLRFVISTGDDALEWFSFELESVEQLVDDFVVGVNDDGLHSLWLLVASRLLLLLWLLRRLLLLRTGRVQVGERTGN